MRALLDEPTGQGWLQLFELGLALVLSALIGLERELRQKSAGCAPTR
jgi:putative Mg2+ transporter-C (MgtC) family protein